VDSVGEISGFIKGESGGKEGGIEEQPDEVLNGLIGFVLIGLFLKFNDNGVVRVKFHSLLGCHV